MSWRTKCNYCELELIKANNPGKEVTVEDDMYDMKQVYIDGKAQPIWYMEVPNECKCFD